jgi:hypothetical protein
LEPELARQALDSWRADICQEYQAYVENINATNKAHMRAHSNYRIDSFFAKK